MVGVNHRLLRHRRPSARTGRRDAVTDVPAAGRATDDLQPEMVEESAATEEEVEVEDQPIILAQADDAESRQQSGLEIQRGHALCSFDSDPADRRRR